MLKENQASVPSACSAPWAPLARIICGYPAVEPASEGWAETKSECKKHLRSVS